MLAKSELKMLVAEEIGRSIEEGRDGAERNIYRNQGAVTALTKAMEAFGELTQRVKAQVQKGEVELDPEDPTAVAKFVVEKLMDGTRRLDDMREIANKAAVQSEGEKKGWDAASKVAFKTYSEEKRKFQAQMEALAGARVDGNDLVLDDDDNGKKGPPPPRVVGTHPGLSIKAKREAEQANEEAAVAAVKGEQKKPEKKTKQTKVASKKKATPKGKAKGKKG